MKYGFMLITLFFMSACSQTKSAKVASEWDFDHHVRFEQKILNSNDTNSYLVVVQRDPKTHFAQLSMFLLRHAKTICKGHGYKIEILEGVEDFDDHRIAQSYIQPSLKAKIECPAK